MNENASGFEMNSVSGMAPVAEVVGRTPVP